MRLFRSHSLLFSLVLLTLCAGPTVSSPTYAATIERAGKLLNVVADKSVVISLDAPASTIFIANPEIADVQVITPTRIMVLGKKIGETTLLISDDLGRVLANRTIIVNTDIAELERALRTIAPNDNIKVKAVPNGVILSGKAANASTAETARRVALRYISKEDGDIINNIKLAANNQIQIQVRFAEVSREVDKRFGINWETFINSGSFVFGLASGEAIASITSSAIARSSVGDSVNNSMGLTYNEGNRTVNGIIDALAKEGLVTVLAEPTLMAMSGETASFLAGGEFPIPVPQGDNITIEWKQYGVSLAFTPTILSGNRINLHVRPEVSQLSDVGSITLNSIEIPSLTTRRAETTVELGSGQSFAIAGLLNNNQTQSINKFPFLGDVPILGSLFRSTRFQNNESELVIIITPYIVKPTTQEQLALPTDGYKQPTDSERLIEYRQTSNDKNVQPISGHPRTVEIEIPKAQEAPTPRAAPVISVKPAKQPVKIITIKQRAVKKVPVKNSEKISRPVPEKKIKNPRPPGPGGFIME